MPGLHELKVKIHVESTRIDQLNKVPTDIPGEKVHHITKVTVTALMNRKTTSSFPTR